MPFFNEQKVLPEFHQSLVAVLDEMPERCEIVYVDDGSKDDSLMIVQNFSQSSSNVRCIALSRNFGKEFAMSVGLEH